MSEPYLSAVLEKAERVAEQHSQIARSTDHPAHEYLRYAVLRLLEGETDETAADIREIDGVTVGYGEDESMFDSWGGDVEWWETVPPREECTRFRIFYPDEYEIVPRVIVDVMAALGAWRVWAGNAAACGSYDHRERHEVHYLWPKDHPVEELLHERLSGPAEAVAPDGGRTGDVRDRLVVDENTQSQDDLEPRTKRAVAESMDVSLLSKGGRYEVQSASGNRYEVDVVDKSCTCPDWQQRSPEGGCKHLRRVDHEIKRGRVPRPDGRLPADTD
ncbi:SWIM zinc finger family protein [Haloplanus halobius]|uniref:SWIM zinc finger family protein n=1 Tax=Haloplanus halobius TaxID=2934938 RepID=UPI00200D3925|nr:SWIM zinc finger family protein [Haloplanus sp. XH21]